VQAQLEVIVEDFESAQHKLGELAAGLSDEQWMSAADPTRWSAAQCVGHLNLTSRAFIPIIREALEKCRSLDGKPPARYRLDFMGWIIWQASGPTRGFGRVRTTAAFVPLGDLSTAEVLGEFAKLQQEQIKCVRDADGLPLAKVKVASPFNTRIHYSVYSALSILPRHQHRHIRQAEGAAKAARG
jgi:hypothetical protein